MLLEIIMKLLLAAVTGNMKLVRLHNSDKSRVSHYLPNPAFL